VRALLLVVALAGCGYHPGVGATDPSDGAIADVGDGPPPDGPPQFVGSQYKSVAGVSNTSYELAVPSVVRGYLLVTVQIGTNCPAANPTVASVTYAGQALTRVTSIDGTPCGPLVTRSEHWHLIAPPRGTANVVVRLSGVAQTIHTGAFVVSGVNQNNPVRDSATMFGTGLSSMIVVASDPSDLVIDTIGQGRGIVTPGASQTMRYVNNVDTSNTLNNSAAATSAGAVFVTATWTFVANPDEWQAIATSLRP
jgi:hypothetical protein